MLSSHPAHHRHKHATATLYPHRSASIPGGIPEPLPMQAAGEIPGSGKNRQKVLSGERCPKPALYPSTRKVNHPPSRYCGPKDGLVEMQFTQDPTTPGLKRYAEFKTDYVSLLEGQILYSLTGRCKEDYYGSILPQDSFAFVFLAREIFPYK